MNLFTGVTIMTMAAGHLIAVTIKLVGSDLQGSVLVLYPIGVLLMAPAVFVVWHALSLMAGNQDRGNSTVRLNAWLALTLNIAYHLHSRRLVGWAIVGVAAALNVGLLIGSLIFLASGQSFEQFSGMR